MTKRSDFVYWWRENGPAFSFITFTCIGIAYILFAKFGDFNPFFTTGVPVGIMLCYAASSFLLRILNIHSEQAGDNLYYMGFLFTLTSLGVSLYLFDLTGSAQTIINNFGVAVGSTIAGVFLRVIFTQARRDPLDIERNMRHELAEMTRRVRTEMDSASRELSSYRRSSGQMVTEGLEEIVKQAKINGELIQKTFDSLSQEAIKPIQDTATKLAALIERSNEMVDKHADRSAEAAGAAATKIAEATSSLSETVTTLQTSVQKVVNNLDSLHMPADLIKVELAPVAQTVQQLVETQKSFVAQMLENQTQNVSALKEALEPLGTVRDAMVTVNEAMNAIKSSNDKTGETLADRLDKFGVVLEQVQSIDGSVRALSENTNSIGASLDDVTHAIIEIRRGNDANAEAQSDNSARINNVIQQVEALEGSLKVLNDTAINPPAISGASGAQIEDIDGPQPVASTPLPPVEPSADQSQPAKEDQVELNAPDAQPLKPKLVEVNEDEERAKTRGWWFR